MPPNPALQRTGLRPAAERQDVRRIHDVASGLRNTKVPADLLGEEVGDFGVARHRFNSAIRGVSPE